MLDALSGKLRIQQRLAAGAALRSSGVLVRLERSLMLLRPV